MTEVIKASFKINKNNNISGILDIKSGSKNSLAGLQIFFILKITRTSMARPTKASTFPY
jgi:hypothetical protein